MRTAPAVLALSLLAAAGPAAPQVSQPAPAQERPAASPVLNLKLDDAGRYTRETTPQTPRDGVERKAADNLPSLGGNAVTLERPPVSRAASPAKTFPEDTEVPR